ncbi:MAG: glycoside hydrolase family 20 zincin-like fold domain-containing protein [Phycisphaerae bacterium]
MGLPLLPHPRSLKLERGTCRVTPTACISLHVGDARVERAVLAWRASCASATPAGMVTYGQAKTATAAEVARGGKGAVTRARSTEARSAVRIVVQPNAAPHRDGYRLAVGCDCIEIAGGSPAACFHALQTLRQLSIRCQGAWEIPCCTVVDWPDYNTRGLLHDVTRGKVPRLSTLKLLVDRLAELKVNQLQLYLEHAFVFSFDPGICGPDEGITPDDARELDCYCRERFIDLVPALATLGHMGRILSMPRYRHLAEIPATRPWSGMTWPQRVRGLTLDFTNPEARRLAERMWSDVLDAFSSPIVNICGDEPHDLGKGLGNSHHAGRRRLARTDKGIEHRCPESTAIGRTSRTAHDEHARGSRVDHARRTYAEYLKHTQEFCAVRGRKTQFWSDVVAAHPELLARMPADSTVLHWGYNDGADYNGTAALVKASSSVYVCPGTSGWKRIINAMGLAERNIAAFAKVGINHGAMGLLNTDWGDHGHFNQLACSWHGIALGAALAWDSTHSTGGEFDALFAHWLMGSEQAEVVSKLRTVARLADRFATWRLLWAPVPQVQKEPALPTLEELEESHQASAAVQSHLERLASVIDSGAVESCDLKELALACRFTGLLAEKLAYARRIPAGRGGHTAARHSGVDPSRGVRTGPSPPGDANAWCDRLDEATRAYVDRWHVRNKSSGIGDICRALQTANAELGPSAPRRAGKSRQVTPGRMPSQ